ncbi:MAG: hypothetical protein IKQ44_10505 [Lachnospiraceae bacterium]|nr:hypothetical protein [Lachnospiraceae bacterium]
MKRLAAYNQTYIMVSLFLAVVVIAQFLMLDDGYFDYISQLNANKFKTSRYEYVISPSDKETIDSLIEGLPDRVSGTNDITIVGMTLLDDNKCSIITYYPEVSSSRKVQVINGDSIKDLEEGCIVCNDLPNSAYQIDGNNYLKLKNDQYKVIGIGNGSDAYQYVDREMGASHRFYCIYSDYWNITTSAVELVFQYDSPLSITEEKMLQNHIKSYTGLKDYIAPESLDPEYRHEMIMRFVYIVTMVMFCLICNYNIISYLFFKLNDEYQISRICGATELRIIMMKLMDLLITGVFASIVGTIGYVLLNKVAGTDHTLPEQSRFIAINIAVYFVVLLAVAGIGGIYGRIRHRT